MPNATNYIQTLQDAIRKAYGCKSKYMVTVPVEEAFQGETVWKGWVEVFDLIGHPTARQCYAWGHAMRAAGEEVHIVTVLGIPPVVSPLTAVRAAILSEIKSVR